MAGSREAALADADLDPSRVIEESLGHSQAVPNAIVLACLGLLVGTVLRFLETQVGPLIRIKWKSFALPPYTLSVFLAGIAISAIRDAHLSDEGHAGGEEASILGAVQSAQLVDPHVILLVFLPPLIYEASSSMNYHTFHRVRWQALLLAFPGVIMQTFLAATAMRYLFAYGSEAEGGLWDWDVALTFGAIVCATDPVAVVATLHEIGAPEKLANVIDGESLLNDGSAMVVFGIFLHNVEAKETGGVPHTFWTGLGFFLRLSVGGAAVGGMFFQMVSSWLAFVENDYKVEVAVLLVAVYACFSFSELVAGVSGVLAVVTFGLLMGRRGKYALSPAATSVAHSTLPMLAHISETMIFFVAGIAAWTSVSTHRDAIQVWHAVPVYLLLLLIRAAATAMLYPLLRRTGYSINVKEAALVVYAGLRGAVGLSLGLLVFQNKLMREVDKDRIHFLVGTVVVLTSECAGAEWLLEAARARWGLGVLWLGCCCFALPGLRASRCAVPATRWRQRAAVGSAAPCRAPRRPAPPPFAPSAPLSPHHPTPALPPSSLAPALPRSRPSPLP
jgi:NhaP-type Na+/H+ or K+/H+ antiporter